MTCKRIICPRIRCHCQFDDIVQQSDVMMKPEFQNRIEIDHLFMITWTKTLSYYQIEWPRTKNKKIRRLAYIQG